ncbi:hypothetical protein ABIE78_000754 [Sinorhizobium fredii]
MSAMSVFSQLTPLKLADVAILWTCSFNWSSSAWTLALSTPSSSAATSFALNSLRTSTTEFRPA